MEKNYEGSKKNKNHVLTQYPEGTTVITLQLTFKYFLHMHTKNTYI